MIRRPEGHTERFLPNGCSRGARKSLRASLLNPLPQGSGRTQQTEHSHDGYDEDDCASYLDHEGATSLLTCSHYAPTGKTDLWKRVTVTEFAIVVAARLLQVNTHCSEPVPMALK